MTASTVTHASAAARAEMARLTVVYSELEASEWPYGRIYISVDGRARLTPNQVRRLIDRLERAIHRAEAQRG